MPIDSDGGELEYRRCKLAVPRGALPEPVFVEIQVPDRPPQDVLPDSAYQLNPDGLKLLRDALLTIAYYDEDVPVGRDETDLTLVHNVDGVWVELSNTKVHIHNNTVEAPVRYLGLYGLRVSREDPRRLNTPPVALFEHGLTPFPGMLGTPLEEARASTEPPAEDAAEPDGTENAPEEMAEEDAADAEEAPETPAEGLFKQQSRVVERRVVCGPTSNENPGGDRTGGQAEAAGNVAEGEAPEQPEGGDEEPAPPTAPEVTIYFDASKSHDPDGKVVQYDWDFDADGVFDYTSHSSHYAEHTFRVNGDYSVVLKVTDNGRYAQAGYGTGIVEIRSPVSESRALAANISAFPPAGPCPLTTHLAASVTGGTPPYVYKWTFTDGSQSALPNPYTTYPEPECHTIKFSVTDILGEKRTGSLLVQSMDSDHPATPQPRMVLDISPYAEREQAPVTARFKLQVERAAQPVTYRITFGDEDPGEAETITTLPAFEHVYGNAGFYLVKVVATDAELRTASTFATVHAIAPEQARDFTLSEEGVGGDPFSFGHGMHIAFDYTEASRRTVRCYPQDTLLPVEELAFQWDFGDGTYSTERKPEHTFATDGVYEVRLTASDGLQRWRHRVWLPISATGPAAAIQRPAYIEGPAPLRLTWDAIVTRGEEPLRYDWFLGEARRSDPSTYYAFQQPGLFEARLDVYDRWDQPIHAPKIEVRVRPGPVDYRQPLAVIQPLAGSTRAVVVDYTAGNPLPLTSPHAEGPITLVDISADGQRAAIAGEDGLIVKRVGNAEPIVAFLPANGRIAALAATELDAAYATVDTAKGPLTYLLRPDHDPLLVGSGHVLDASGDGSVVLLKLGVVSSLAPAVLLTVDAVAGAIGEPQALGKLYEAALPRDGRELLYLSSEMRLVRRVLASGKEEALSGGDDRKFGLTISGDGNAVAYVSQLGGRKEVIYGRYDEEGVFRLASVTGQTEFFSEHLRLSADGRFLLAYGSRKELTALLERAGGSVAAEDEVADEDLLSNAEPVVDTELDEESAEEIADEGIDTDGVMRQPRRRERFGVIRLDLAAAPAEWSITKVNPRFVIECQAQFSTAGPF